MPDFLTDGSFWVGVREWAIGLGTVGTLGVSLWVLNQQRTEIQTQAAERRKATEYERSVQARGVILLPTKRVGGEGIARQHRQRSIEVTGINRSAEAIHDVELGIEVLGEVELADGSLVVAPKRVLVLAVGEPVQHRVVVRSPWDDSITDYKPFDVRPSLTFTDMAGQRWVRDHEHRLRQL